ncbi:recombinase RecA [Infirmifilum lucidum]|uniref:Recombinase RecA n=1 Tax=Infirmifilum lucidum TaxID=2776706 RepID=A0A7L9FGZ3_9CREN|nr:ATPase domain-containing protein [Infirmifilum lucidum]QOJ78214.1 recombinase RecA [Infirmifilum lucidum]
MFSRKRHEQLQEGQDREESAPIQEEIVQERHIEGSRRGVGYELVKTGIEGLDERIGGLLRGRSYLVTGETGTGKTLFSMTFLVRGAMMGEPGIYVLVDEDYDDFARGAYDFGWDIEALMSQRLLSVLTLMPDFVEKLKNKPADVVVGSIVSGILEEAARIKARRLVIDPIAPLMVNEGDVAWTREYIKSLIINLEKRIGTTNIIVSEIPTGSTALSRFGVEEFLAAGVFVLGLERVRNTFYRTLFIRKMRWRPVPPDIFVFDIVEKKGVVVKDKLSRIVV